MCVKKRNIDSKLKSMIKKEMQIDKIHCRNTCIPGWLN